MLECPANYFGKGEDYVLPENADELRTFEHRFAQWEREHPEDPDGSIALAHAKLNAQPTEEKNVSPSVGPSEVFIPRAVMDESQKLKLELPLAYIEKLKKYASFKRRRPRDIIMAWIDANCKL